MTVTANSRRNLTAGYIHVAIVAKKVLLLI